jgi:hypothetical protein
MTLREIMTDCVSSKPIKVKNRFAASNIPRDDGDMIESPHHAVPLCGSHIS